MENNNGRGVFYGVIGVATLVVAIIGATFAYFSAQTNTDPNVIRADAAIIQLDIATDEENTDMRAEMIPVEADGTTTKTGTADIALATSYSAAFPKFPGPEADMDPNTEGNQAREACQDLLGNNICSIYTFTVSNPSTAAQKIYGFLTVESNTFTNLKYAVFKGTPSQVTSATATMWNVLGTPAAADANGNFTTIANGELVKRMTAVPTTTIATGDISNDQSFIPAMTVTLDADGGANDSVTYTVLLWIEETGSDQTSSDSFAEAGTPKSFRGGILVNTSGGGDGVTATLILS